MSKIFNNSRGRQRPSRKQPQKKKVASYNLQDSRRLSKSIFSTDRPGLVYSRFLLLVSRFVESKYYYKLMFDLLKNRQTKDMDIYKIIYKYIKKTTNNYQKDIRFFEFKSDKIIDLLPPEFLKNTESINYLDIGCGNCQFTKIFGERVSATFIAGVDVEEEFEKDWTKTRNTTDINFKFIKQKRGKAMTKTTHIPTFGRKFHIISCMMVLHHVSADLLNSYLKEIYNLLESGGLFILREHDCVDSEDKIIFDVEHDLYVLQSSSNWSEFQTQPLQDNNYKSREEWNRLIFCVGSELGGKFELIVSKFSFMKKKVSISANRNYISIYRKK
jgi:SAM-dependent methyltransferase